jgi:type I restriction enzyme S subunit
MSDSWKNYKLGEILILLTDYHANGAYEKLKANVTLLDSSDYAIMIRTKNFEQNSFANDLKYIDKHAYNYLSKSKVYPGDLIMNKIANPGTVYFMPDLRRPVSLAMNLFLLRINSSIANQFYVYNYLRLHEDYVKSFSAGTAAKTITKDAVRNLDIILPPLPEQQAIAEILSALDEKIELNLKMNKTLEEMANTLYKHWFVDFGPFKDGKFVASELGMIPEGWSIETFSNIYELRKGLSYKSAFYSEDGIPMINLKCVDRNGGFRYDGIKYYKGEYKPQHVVTHGDLLVAMTDLTQDRSVVGSPLLAPNIKSKSDVIASLDLSILKQIDEDFPNLNLYFYYLMRTKQYHEYIVGFGNGSTVVHLDKMGIVNYRALLPTKEVVEGFNNQVESIRKMIELNREENDSLTVTRNYLLPKLISGEIRVKDAAKAVKEIV